MNIEYEYFRGFRNQEGEPRDVIDDMDEECNKDMYGNNLYWFISHFRQTDWIVKYDIYGIYDVMMLWCYDVMVFMIFKGQSIVVIVLILVPVVLIKRSWLFLFFVGLPTHRSTFLCLFCIFFHPYLIIIVLEHTDSLWFPAGCQHVVALWEVAIVKHRNPSAV